MRMDGQSKCCGWTAYDVCVLEIVTCSLSPYCTMVIFRHAFGIIAGYQYEYYYTLTLRVDL